MEYAEIARALGVTENAIYLRTFKALRRIIAAGVTAQFLTVVLAARYNLRELRQLEAEAARAAEMAHRAKLKPRVIKEAEALAERARGARLQVEASLQIRCGSIECRPEKWVFFAGR